MVTNIKLQLNYERGNFTFSNLDFNGKSEDFFDLATAFNSLQNEEAKEIRKIVRTILL